MTNSADWKTKAASVLLCLLMVGEIVIASKSPEGRNNFFSTILVFLQMSGVPLLAMLVAVLKGSVRPVALGCAWTSIATGFLIQYAIFVSHADALIYGISWIVYWLCGFFTLSSFARNKRP